MRIINVYGDGCQCFGRKLKVVSLSKQLVMPWRSGLLKDTGSKSHTRQLISQRSCSCIGNTSIIFLKLLFNGLIHTQFKEISIADIGAVGDKTHLWVKCFQSFPQKVILYPMVLLPLLLLLMKFLRKIF